MRHYFKKQFHYLFLKGMTTSPHYCIFHMYAEWLPNWNDPIFFNNLFSNLSNISTHNLIIKGDANSKLLSPPDRSSLARAPLSKSAQSIINYLKIMVWLIAGNFVILLPGCIPSSTGSIKHTR